MMKTAKKKVVVVPPAPLIDRAAVLFEEALAAPPETRDQIIQMFQHALDAKIDEIAEAARPNGMPVAVVRTQMDAEGWKRMHKSASGFGTCLCEAMKQ